MKIAAVVILYNPPPGVINNIKTYCNTVGKLYIMDNTEEGAAIKKELKALPGTEYFHDGKNEGLSKRLNEACRFAINEGYNWLLTMDQDSCFEDNSLSMYFDCVKNFKEREYVGLFGISNQRASNSSSGACSFKDDTGIITSGTLMNLAAFKLTGGFDEALYIDAVDHDYSIRAKRAGYRVIRLLNIFLSHELGTEVYRASVKTLFLVKKKKEVHSPLRVYYMYRNMLYLTQKFEKEEPELVNQLKKDVSSRIKKAIFYGRNTGKIIRYLIKAKNDFKNGKMGKIDATL